MNYLYNGVELPALPEWDREAYPYAYISSGLVYYLYLFSEECQITDSGLDPISSATGICYTTNPYTGDTWDYENTLAGSGFIKPIWCNTDLYNSDGTLYLPATAPIPVSTATTWKYNGVELPALPEVDWGTYPYVAIFYMADYNTAILITASNALIRVGNDINTVENGAPYWVYDPDGVMGTASGSWVKADDTTSGGLAEYFSWTNHNVYNEDGTTYLSLSSPVPVVTTKPLNFHLKSFLMGVVDELAGRPSIV